MDSSECTDTVGPLNATYCHSEVILGTCYPSSPINHTFTRSCKHLVDEGFPNPGDIIKSNSFTITCQIGGKWSSPGIGNCLFSLVPEDPGVSDAKLQFYERVIQGAKIMEVVGMCLSWFCLLMAIFVFTCFRSLQCHRTRIHIHLFVAFLLRLTFDIILWVERLYSKRHNEQDTAIRSVPALCQSFEVFREYLRLCTFAWMFIEGVYLNSLLSTAVFGRPKFVVYYVIGWVISIPLVVAWATAMHLTLGSNGGCWHGHMNTLFYWIFIETPRNALLVANCVFLINIVRVLITKLRESNTSESQQVRKAIKATIVLLPLLGIANLVWLVPQPKVTEPKEWIVTYNYGLLFLDAYQGLLVGLLYCFLNTEVRDVIHRKWTAWLDSRTAHQQDPSQTTLTRVLSVITDVRGVLRRKWYAWQNTRNPHRRHHSVVTTATDVSIYGETQCNGGRAL
ncbi:PDF receptor-like isoform X2 [Amphiura filiformis]|uniref:PDF receptor-like isoform X2 n=1 Tax=Amphiura filiformis TaxID=82378 RepID=UPI003B21EC40